MNETERTNRAGLTTKQIEAICALLSCSSVEAAAKRAKVSKVSIYQWLKDARFSQELNKQRQGLMAQSLNCLAGVMGKALETLIGLLDKGTPGIKRLAAKDLIEFTLKVSEVEDIKQRLDLIEASLDKRKK